MNMGERLKELRLKKGATQEEVGKIINVTKPTIMKYEKGLVELSENGMKYKIFQHIHDNHYKQCNKRCKYKRLVRCFA